MCCIRDADNKLYGQLGQLKPLKESSPISVRGRRLPHKGHGTPVRHQPPRRRRVRPAQPGPRARAPRAGADRGADRRDPRGTRRVPVGVAGSPRGAPRGVGHDPDRLRQLLRLLHRAVGARPRGESPVRRHRARGRGARARRSGRGHRARSERQLVRTRSRRRSVPAAVRRPARALDAVDGIERIRFTSPHPKDLRPDTIAAMAECATVCEHLHLPLQSGSDRTLARMHRGYTAARYLERLGAARVTIGDLAVTTDIIVGFPGETDHDFEATLEVVEAAQYDAAYTFVFSPRPGTEAATMTADFVDPDIVRDRMARLMETVERSALVKHADRVGRVEDVLVEGPSKTDPEVWSGRTRHNKLLHFAPDAEVAAGEFVTARVTSAAPHWLRGGCWRGSARPAGAGCASRSWQFDPTSHARRTDGVGQVGLGAPAGAVTRRRRDRLARLDAGLPRARHRHGQADPGRARRGRASPGRRGRPGRGVVGAAHAARRPCRDRRHRGPRDAALLVGGTGLYVRAVVDDLEIPPTDASVRARDRRRGRSRRVGRARTNGSPIRSRPRRAWSPATGGASCARSR